MKLLMNALVIICLTCVQVRHVWPCGLQRQPTLSLMSHLHIMVSRQVCYQEASNYAHQKGNWQRNYMVSEQTQTTNFCTTFAQCRCVCLDPWANLASAILFWYSSYKWTIHFILNIPTANSSLYFPYNKELTKILSYPSEFIGCEDRLCLTFLNLENYYTCKQL